MRRSVRAGARGKGQRKSGRGRILRNKQQFCTCNMQQQLCTATFDPRQGRVRVEGCRVSVKAGGEALTALTLARQSLALVRQPLTLKQQHWI